MEQPLSGRTAPSLAIDASISVVGLYLFLVELLCVNLVPAVNYVGQDDGNEERHVEHGAQGELAAA